MPTTPSTSIYTNNRFNTYVTVYICPNSVVVLMHTYVWKKENRTLGSEAPFS